MRKVFSFINIALLLLSCPSFAFGQAITGAFMSMPKEIVPYISAEQRELLCHQYSENGFDAEPVTNVLDGKCAILAITEDYIKVQTSDVSDIQLVAFVPEGGDTTYCFISTHYAPKAESIISFYSKDWTLLHTFIPSNTIDEFFKEGITEEEIRKVRTSLEWIMVKAEYEPESSSIEFSLSLPNLSTIEIEELNSLLVTKKEKIYTIYANKS